VGVEEIEEAERRTQKARLLQNTPNPFPNNTTIRYQIPSRGDGKPKAVSLSIYDISGRLTATLVNEEKEAGYYSVNWDRKDTHGRELSNGVYFYRLNVGTNGDSPMFTQTRKMVLLK
jgi:flagellar hook assembly protein FlgD